MSDYTTPRAGTAVRTPDGNGVMKGVTGSRYAVALPDGRVMGYDPDTVHPTDARVYVLHPREQWALSHKATGTIIAGRRWDNRETAFRFLESLPAETRAMLDAWPVTVRELVMDEAAEL